MAQDYSQVNFRIPTKLKEDIEKASLTNNRSITAELVSRLEESFAAKVPNTLEMDAFKKQIEESFSAKVPNIMEMDAFKKQMDEQTKVLLEQQKIIAEQNEKQARILAEILEFQDWKNKKETKLT